MSIKLNAKRAFSCAAIRSFWNKYILWQIYSETNIFCDKYILKQINILWNKYILKQLYFETNISWKKINSEIYTVLNICGEFWMVKIGSFTGTYLDLFSESFTGTYLDLFSESFTGTYLDLFSELSDFLIAI